MSKIVVMERSPREPWVVRGKRWTAEDRVEDREVHWLLTAPARFPEVGVLASDPHDCQENESEAELDVEYLPPASAQVLPKGIGLSAQDHHRQSEAQEPGNADRTRAKRQEVETCHHP